MDKLRRTTGVFLRTMYNFCRTRVIFLWTMYNLRRTLLVVLRTLYNFCRTLVVVLRTMALLPNPQCVLDVAFDKRASHGAGHGVKLPAAGWRVRTESCVMLRGGGWHTACIFTSRTQSNSSS